MLAKLLRRYRKPKEETIEPIDFGLIGVDIHSHLIPNVDDGSTSYEETKTIMSKMKEYGFKKWITTPHIMIDGYPNTSNGLKKGLSQLKDNLLKDGHDFDISIASEYYFDSHFMALLERKDLLTMNEENYVLIEFSYLNKPLNAMHGIAELKANGYRVILAHPERYNFFHGDLQAYRDLKNAGVLFQLNMFSLVNAYGPGAMMTARMLVDEEMYDFIGTDIHNQRQLAYLEKARRSRYLKKVLDSGRILNSKVFS